MPLIVNTLNRFTSSKLGKMVLNSPISLGTLTTLSGVSKDAVNCAFYTWQSYTNKRIPEDKKNFVAALDLSNGLLNVTLQLGAGALFDMMFPKVYDKFVGPKLFSKQLAKNMKDKLGISLAKAQRNVSTLNKMSKNGLLIIGTLLVTQVFVKRVVVPSIATPLAGYFKNKFDKNDNKHHHHHNKPINQDTVNFENKPEIANNKTESLPKCFKDFKK